MGHVLLAHHATTRKEGALKLVNADTAEDQELTARFRREVEVLANLRHPAVVGLLDAGELDDKPWLVMEYVAGENLERRIKTGAPIGQDRALLEFAALADGLAQAHAKGIHHRDIKAENVVVDSNGRAVLVDFGVALHLSASRLTRAGNVMGTMAYLPPEVLEGGGQDPAAHDQYALGQLLYEVLTHQLAFRGTTDSQGRQKFGNLITEKGNALDPGAGFPDRVREVVRRATDPEPTDRFPTMREFGLALEALLTKSGRTELERRLLRAGTESGGWWKWVLVLVIVLGLLAAFGLGGMVAILLLALVVVR